MIDNAPNPRRITDAIIVLPGIMGSELIDPAAGDKIVWGMKLSMTRAFLAHMYRGVTVTPEEREGHPRLRPSRLIRLTGLLSLLGAQGPYQDLVKRLQREAADPSAVLPFPYDWRLSVTYNADLLVKAALEHLESWRAALKQIVAQDDGPLRRLDVDSVRLSLVAHSMGGLVARHACLDPALATSVRKIVSLGTPYRGSAKSVAVLAAGKTGNRMLDEQAARALAVGCPGVYDLLPREPVLRCMDGWRGLTPEDLASMGADARLGREAAERWEAIHPDRAVIDVQTLPVIGAAQPTPRTVSVNGDQWTPEAVDWDGYLSLGDGPVPDCAPPLGLTPHAYVSGHEELANHPVTIEAVVRHLRPMAEPPPQALAPPRALGLVLPLTTAPGKVTAFVSEEGIGNPRRAGISVMSTSETPSGLFSRSEDWRWDGVSDGRLMFSRTLGPGIHRVRVTGGGTGVSATTAVLSDE